jgi:hypothetical protein
LTVRVPPKRCCGTVCSTSAKNCWARKSRGATTLRIMSARCFNVALREFPPHFVQQRREHLAFVLEPTMNRPAIDTHGLRHERTRAFPCTEQLDDRLAHHGACRRRFARLGRLEHFRCIAGVAEAIRCFRLVWLPSSASSSLAALARFPTGGHCIERTVARLTRRGDRSSWPQDVARRNAKGRRARHVPSRHGRLVPGVVRLVAQKLHGS